MDTFLRNAVFSCIYGGIVGDALGVPYEFLDRGTYEATTMVGYGTYDMPPGTWSDDSSTTICLILNLIEQGDLKDLMNRFLLWYTKAAYTSRGITFDVGNTTRRAILRYKLGASPEFCGDPEEKNNGNGALMRIAPIAFILRNVKSFEERVATIKKYAEVTHRHPRSTLACIIFIEILLHLFQGEDLEIALKKACTTCEENLKATEYKNEFAHYERLFSGEIKNAKLETIKSNGYVVYTLEAALWSCFNSRSFKDTLLTAVNLGRDTDTVAAVSGNIAGMLYCEKDKLPAEWINNIARKKAIDELLDKFYEFLIDTNV
ncbi:MAG: ADP-ribosylglycohydrolase family protein [Treponemataceae bacterium]